MATTSDLIASRELLQECKSKILGHMKHARDMFLEDYLSEEHRLDYSTTSQLKRIKCLDEYDSIPPAHIPNSQAISQDTKALPLLGNATERAESLGRSDSSQLSQILGPLLPKAASNSGHRETPSIEDGSLVLAVQKSLARKTEGPRLAKPQFHPQWKLMRVISGHLGWVRSIAVDISNHWFATGSADRVIKIWDLASGTLKLSLTGHINTVRGLCVSDRHPYLFSCGDDRMVKCWDLESNKVVRHYHGHLSGVYAITIHPSLDVLITSGRDATARVWDIRTKQAIHILSGHQNTVADVKSQDSEPQIITASMDSTVKLWDLAAGKCRTTLTHHKKSVRALAIHPIEYTFASASSDNIKQWKCPDGQFLQNLAGHRAIINTLSVNADGVLFSGADNGSMSFWDWKSGHRFQELQSMVQPGSLDSEAGIFASSFDRTGSRLITCEADKTIKIWKVNPFNPIGKCCISNESLFIGRCFVIHTNWKNLFHFI
jgi:WD40 repeat protein